VIGMVAAQDVTVDVSGTGLVGGDAERLRGVRALQGVLPGAGDLAGARRRAGGAAPPPGLWRPPAAQQLLARAATELAAAEAEPDPAQRFLRAHLAALRAGASALAGRGSTAARGRPRAVWELVRREVPELGAWTAYFAAGAALRAAVESGREPPVSRDQADQVLTMAGLFIEMIEGLPAARAS
jgi:hypothetical protein